MLTTWLRRDVFDVCQSEYNLHCEREGELFYMSEPWVGKNGADMWNRGQWRKRAEQLQDELQGARTELSAVRTRNYEMQDQIAHLRATIDRITEPTPAIKESIQFGEEALHVRQQIRIAELEGELKKLHKRERPDRLTIRAVGPTGSGKGLALGIIVKQLKALGLTTYTSSMIDGVDEFCLDTDEVQRYSYTPHPPTTKQMEDGLREADRLFMLCEYHLRANPHCVGTIHQIAKWKSNFNSWAAEHTGAPTWRLKENLNETYGKFARSPSTYDDNPYLAPDYLKSITESGKDFARFFLGSWDLDNGPLYYQRVGRGTRERTAKCEAEAYLWGRKINDPITDLDMHKLSSDAWDIVRESTERYTHTHTHVFDSDWTPGGVQRRGQQYHLVCRCKNRWLKSATQEDPKADWSWCSVPGNPQAVADMGRYIAARAVIGTEPIHRS